MNLKDDSEKIEILETIKKLDKSQIYLISVPEVYDCKTMADISDCFAEAGIKVLIVRKDMSVKELPAESKINLKEFTTRLQSLCHDGFALSNFTVVTESGEFIPENIVFKVHSENVKDGFITVRLGSDK